MTNTNFVREFRCPTCKKGLFTFHGQSEMGKDGSIRCEKCGEVFLVIDGIYIFCKRRRSVGGIDYTLEDWVEKEREKEREYERKQGFDGNWIRSLPYPKIKTETSFQYKGRALGDNFFDVLEQLNLKGTERVFDMAAGTCWTSNEFARRGCSVVCTDVLTIKYYGLRSAEAYFERAGVNFQRICWAFGPIPFDGESFDIVFCQNAFQYVGDLRAMIKEVYRVLKPNGKFVLAYTGARAPLKSDRWGPGHYLTKYLAHARKCGFSVHVFPPVSLYERFDQFFWRNRMSVCVLRLPLLFWKRAPIFRRLYLRYASLPVGFLFGIPFNMIAVKNDCGKTR